MKKIILSIALLGLAVSPLAAADTDSIAVRKALMQSVGASAGAAGAMLKGEMDYNPVVAKAAIASMNGAAMAFGSFFPEGSNEGGHTEAAPKIWEDMTGFQAAVAKFAMATNAAVEASGKSGPADLNAFKAAIGPVFGNCKSCHETFRVAHEH